MYLNDKVETMKKTCFTTCLLYFCTLLSFNAQLVIPNQLEYLDANEVRAAVLNGGDAFWNLNSVEPELQVPYSGSESPSTMFSAEIWLFAQDSTGKKHMASLNYRRLNNCTFVPGFSTYPDRGRQQSVSQAWNKIFKVYGHEIMAHIEDYQDGEIDVVRPSIFGWPARGNEHFEGIHGFMLFGRAAAAFVETAGHINGIYEPHFGEYPHVEGLSSSAVPGVIAWCVYNTGNHVDQNPLSRPVLEVQQTAWAMSCPDDLLSKTIFLKYAISNPHSSTWHNFLFGLWVMPSLGCPADDYFGCSPSDDAFYIYNADNDDQFLDCDGITASYGTNPPVQMITFLNSAMDGFYYHSDGRLVIRPAMSRPATEMEYCNFVNGIWRDGIPLTKGGNGYNIGSKDSVQFAFPDRPSNPLGWSMHTAGLSPLERRLLAVNRTDGNEKAISLAFGATVTYDLAFTYFREEGLDHVENVDFGLSRLSDLRSLYDKGFEGCDFPVCDCACVWPGDSDNNGKVEYIDAVNIFKVNEISGVARDAPVAWLGRETVNWPKIVPGSVNAKYSDSDGNGVVNEKDIGILNDFYGQYEWLL